MFLSRSKAAPTSTTSTSDETSSVSKSKASIPEFEDFLKQRDLTGAVALLEHEIQVGRSCITDDLWLAYLFFHLGQFQKAIDRYQNLLAKNVLPLNRRPSGQDPGKVEKGKQMLVGLFKSKKGQKTDEQKEVQLLSASFCQEDIHLYIACCNFFLGRDKEALDAVSKISMDSSLKNRLKVMLDVRRGVDPDVKKLLNQEDVQDQMCEAAVHFLNLKFQEAIEMYKKVLINNREYVAVNVYIALSYYKMDYYDISQEILQLYLKQIPDSSIAMNLKSCNTYRLFNGKAAEAELRSLIEEHSTCEFAKELIRHNLVVFRSGESALHVLPPLIDILPEARLNLAIYHVKNNEFAKAYDLMKDVEPKHTNELIVSAVIHTIAGQEDVLPNQSRDCLKKAQMLFQTVGGSSSECDTIPGRQCMASCFFLMKQYTDVIVYLSSIKSYFYNDDSFNFNYGQVKAVTKKYGEALQCLTQVTDEKVCNSKIFILWIIRCNIMCNKTDDAWTIYRNIQSSTLSFQSLTLIANDCYRSGQFLHSMKAFNMLDKLDNNNPENWEGVRGAAGHFQKVIAKKEHVQTLDEVISLLRMTSNPQAGEIINVIKKWIKSQDEV